MNDDVIQAGVMKEFFKFLESQGTKVNITPLQASDALGKARLDSVFPLQMAKLLEWS